MYKIDKKRIRVKIENENTIIILFVIKINSIFFLNTHFSKMHIYTVLNEKWKNGYINVIIRNKFLFWKKKN